jgi:hypothetical protein
MAAHQTPRYDYTNILMVDPRTVGRIHENDRQGYAGGSGGRVSEVV